ncbi:hypothetical protein LUX57_52540 [Actinomadura madurae]|nr:hypothetical protein [Actinomadura madurae]MCP9972650.1 hypothetical protein [Actinomadura madurae]
MLVVVDAVERRLAQVLQRPRRGAGPKVACSRASPSSMSRARFSTRPSV